HWPAVSAGLAPPLPPPNAGRSTGAQPTISGRRVLRKQQHRQNSNQVAQWPPPATSHEVNHARSISREFVVSCSFSSTGPAGSLAARQKSEVRSQKPAEVSQAPLSPSP